MSLQDPRKHGSFVSMLLFRLILMQLTCLENLAFKCEWLLLLAFGERDQSAFNEKSALYTSEQCIHFC